MTRTESGTSWGEASKQAHPAYPDPDPSEVPKNWTKRHTDADEIRRKFGMKPFDPSQFDAMTKPYPNCIDHEPPGESEWGHIGGTNFLAVGEKGSGKSTLGLYTAARLMEVNNEAVVWRGSSSRSEWLPFKHWTTLLLPRSADIEPSWKPRDIRKSNAGDDAELSEIVREVKYYDDPVDLNDKLEPGKFHVVYPDPTFAGCEEIMAGSDFCPTPVPFTPVDQAGDDEQATPLVHWWFAWMTAKLEYGPYDWTTLIFDEAADLAPDDAKADDAETYEKVQTLRRVMADSRKFYFSLFFFAHHEANLHSKIRRTVQWRVNMADETANPCRANGDRPPVGFNAIPMEQDQLSFRDVGHGLFWTEQRFTRFKWDDIPVEAVDQNRWLKISLDEPSGGDTRPRGSDQRADTRGAADD
jgi:hypothetical protein